MFWFVRTIGSFYEFNFVSWKLNKLTLQLMWWTHSQACFSIDINWLIRLKFSLARTERLRIWAFVINCCCRDEFYCREFWDVKLHTILAILAWIRLSIITSFRSIQKNETILKQLEIFQHSIPTYYGQFFCDDQNFMPKKNKIKISLLSIKDRETNFPREKSR